MQQVDLSSFLETVRNQFGQFKFDRIVLCTGCVRTDGSVYVIESDGMGREFTQNPHVMVTETGFLVMNNWGFGSAHSVNVTNTKIVVAYPDTSSMVHVARMSTFADMLESFYTIDLGKIIKLSDFLKVFATSQKKGENKDVAMFTTSGWCC